MAFVTIGGVRPWGIVALALGLAACGGSGSGDAAGSGNTPPPQASCDANANDPGQDCGTVLVTLTDADGDLLSYTVDVLSLTLERGDGVIVETLSAPARVDLAQYLELSELVSSAAAPNGIYVGGALRVDYSNAEIIVEVDGAAVPATLVDATGAPPGILTLALELADDARLVVQPGVPALLEVDFDLEASNTVDMSGAAPVVTVEPFVVAQIDPVDSKEVRVRGLLREADTENGRFALTVRPFQLRDGAFGRIEVTTDEQTRYDLDGQTAEGADGLLALSGMDAGTPVVVQGGLDVGAREFRAGEVLAGSSVPGSQFDAVSGSVLARNGDELTLIGASLTRTSGEVSFNDELQVLIGPDTVIAGSSADNVEPPGLAISVGQHIVALGSFAAASQTLDASAGGVRLRPTHLGGSVIDAGAGLLRMRVETIDRRDAERFDFRGTGTEPDADALASDYEVATGNLTLASIEPADPIQVTGLVRPFGTAPADFDAVSVADYSESHAQLALSWQPGAGSAAFAIIGPDELVPLLDDATVGRVHRLRLGGLAIDLFDLDGAPTIAPDASHPGVYAIGEPGHVQMFRDFAEFTTELAARLGGSREVRAVYARGGYEAAANVLSAKRVAVLLD